MPNRRLYTLDTLEMLAVMAADGSSGWGAEKKADIELIGVDEGFGCACAKEYRSKRWSRYWVGLR